STKPPTAVMMPRVSSSGFKLVLDLLQALGMGPQFGGRGVLGLAEQCVDLAAIGRIRLGERLSWGGQPVCQPLVHGKDISACQPARGRLLVDQRPFGGDRPRLLDIL